MDEFERQLRAQVAPGCRMRPFTCDGNPLDCQVFIVGFNPATDLNVDFWTHWEPGYGFLEQQWEADYRRFRFANGKSGESNVRGRMRWFKEEVGSMRCLVTNLYATPTRRAKDLPRSLQDASLFKFLVNFIKPEFLVPHGAHAREYFEKNRVGGWVIPAPAHFSRIGQVAARTLGQRVRRYAMGR